eukprot:3271302-Alexandrium_andersonii.AAC.1
MVASERKGRAWRLLPASELWARAALRAARRGATGARAVPGGEGGGGAGASLSTAGESEADATATGAALAELAAPALERSTVATPSPSAGWTTAGDEPRPGARAGEALLAERAARAEERESELALLSLLSLLLDGLRAEERAAPSASESPLLSESESVLLCDELELLELCAGVCPTLSAPGASWAASAPGGGGPSAASGLPRVAEPRTVREGRCKRVRLRAGVVASAASEPSPPPTPPMAKAKRLRRAGRSPCSPPIKLWPERWSLPSASPTTTSQRNPPSPGRTQQGLAIRLDAGSSARGLGSANLAPPSGRAAQALSALRAAAGGKRTGTWESRTHGVWQHVAGRAA